MKGGPLGAKLVQTGKDQQFDHLVAGLQPLDSSFGEEPNEMHGYLFLTAAQGLQQLFDLQNVNTFEGNLKSLKVLIPIFFIEILLVLFKIERDCWLQRKKPEMYLGLSN